MVQQTQTIDNEIGIILTFWGTVSILKKGGKSFSKYYLKSTKTPNIPNTWTLEQYTFQEPKKLVLKKGDTIGKVTDSLGNIYYEVTSLI